jgi:uncharacterized protein (TIGR03437 family)
MKLKIPGFLLAVFPMFALTGTSYGQAADKGGAYVNWNPIYPTPAYDAYEWTMTVVQLPNVQTYYYWALQNGFVGGGTFYMGIQPYGGCGITNSGNCKIALFSFFGNGASSTSTSCAPGADGGPGEQCRIPYDWVIGHQYKLRAALTANDGSTETWTGTIADLTAGTSASTIGSWGIPASAGLIGTQGISFTEYYELYSGGCGAEPYAEVIWNTPVGYNKGQAYPGTVRSTEPTTACSSNAAFTINAGSVTVQTGGYIGPFIASVQDAESARASVVPGEWAAIYGQNLSVTTRIWSSGDFDGNSLPTTLDGVSVEFGGVPAALYFVSPGQLDVQVPDGLSGTVPVFVTVNGTQSVVYTATVVPSAPSLFVYANGPTVYAAATHVDGSLIGDPLVTPNSSPASPGETIVLYVNGLQASPSGTIISSPVPDNSPVTVTIGGVSASVTFQGLVSTGLFQINTVVPTGLGSGSYSIFTDLTFSGANANNNGPGYCITGASTANCGPMTTRWIASPFTPSGDCTLAQVNLALGWSSGANGAVISLVNTQSGSPGTTVLQSWTVTNLPAAGPDALITLTATSPVTLNRGVQYWLIVKGLAGDTLDFWGGNTSGLTGTLTSLDQGATWNNGTLNLSAFDVLGAPVSGNAAAVPVVVTAGGVSSPAGVILPVGGK